MTQHIPVSTQFTVSDEDAKKLAKFRDRFSLAALLGGALKVAMQNYGEWEAASRIYQDRIVRGQRPAPRKALTKMLKRHGKEELSRLIEELAAQKEVVPDSITTE